MKKKNISLPLFWKFAIAIAFTVAFFGGVNAYLIWSDVQLALEKESEKRAVFISQNLANQISSPILYEDYVTVQQLVDETVKLDSSIEYIFIIDEANEIVIHTFDDHVPDQLKYVNIPQNNRDIKVMLINPGKEHNHIIRDISVPILDSRLGILRVGISEESITSDVMLTVNRFWLMVIFFLSAGIIGAFIFAYIITNPIKQIQTVAENLEIRSLKSGNLKKVNIRNRLLNWWILPIRARDEIDDLADRFNDMLMRLQNAYISLEKTQHKLVQTEKLATIGTISSGLAHEINNPIAGMKNCLRRIEKDPKNIEQTKKYLLMMNEAVERVETVVQNLLNFSRKQDLIMRQIRVEEVIERVLVLLAYKLEKSWIAITKKIEPEIPCINGSLIHIEQVLINLILNAIDAIEENKEEVDKVIKIQVGQENGFITIEVEDTGIGIAKENMSKIFDPFYTTKVSGKGTGLGLAVISNIIQSHNGKINVESEVGKGSKFLISIPAVKAK